MIKKQITECIELFFETYGEKITNIIFVIALLECVIFFFVDKYVSTELSLSSRINIGVALDAMFLGVRCSDRERPLRTLEKVNIILMVILLILPVWFLFTE